MKPYGRLIGIDVGTRRIGLARTDLLRMSVNPIDTFSPQEIWGQLQDLVEESRILAFVVGWPTSLSGEKTSSTEMAERFIRKLEKKFPDIPVHRIDERYSSVEAVEQ
ncbi:MAG: Holliday junction resolvase RuvX, partial [Balneolaceae bacterium]